MRTEAAPCPICEARADITRVEQNQYATVSCWSCGSFRFSDDFEGKLKNLSVEARRACLDEAKARAAPGEMPDVQPAELNEPSGRIDHRGPC
jgi:Zn ribbon nucleic-acid-binding protein